MLAVDEVGEAAHHADGAHDLHIFDCLLASSSSSLLHLPLGSLFLGLNQLLGIDLCWFGALRKLHPGMPAGHGLALGAYLVALGDADLLGIATLCAIVVREICLVGASATKKTRRFAWAIEAVPNDSFIIS